MWSKVEQGGVSGVSGGMVEYIVGQSVEQVDTCGAGGAMSGVSGVQWSDVIEADIMMR